MVTDIVVTTAKVGRPYTVDDSMVTITAGTTIAAGQAVYVDSNGKLAVSDASVVSTAKVDGIAVNSASAGQAVHVLRRGFIEGFAVSGMAYRDTVYLSDTAGALNTAAGTEPLVVGKILPLDTTKYLYIDLMGVIAGGGTGTLPTIHTVIATGDVVLTGNDLIVINNAANIVVTITNAPIPGGYLFIHCQNTNTGSTVVLSSGTWDGTNETATFDTDGDYLEARAVSATRFDVTVNSGTVAFS